MAGWIISVHRVIIAIRKHIVPQETLAGAGVGVRVEEPAQNGVVISALEIIEFSFYEECIAIEAKKSAN